MNFNINLDKIFEHIKKTSPIVIALGVAFSIILFAPTTILEKLHLNSIPDGITRIIAILFLICLVLTIITFCHGIISPIIKRHKNRQIHKKMKKKYASLSIEQKLILQQLLRTPNKTVTLPMNDGNAEFLVHSGFLYRPQQLAGFDAYGDNVLVKYLPQQWHSREYQKDPDYFMN